MHHKNPSPSEPRAPRAPRPDVNRLRPWWTLALLLALLMLTPSVFAQPAGYTPYTGKQPIITAVDAAAKTVDLKIIGSDGLAGIGFNFNGYAHGKMIIQVPLGWTVNTTFSVDSVFHHSLAFVPWAERHGNTFSDAFPGSNLPHPREGLRKKNKPVTFSFVAGKAGTYAMVCEVPGHTDLGMWDQFDVVSGLSRPRVYVK